MSAIPSVSFSGPLPHGVTDRKLYGAALGMERQLLGELTKSMAGEALPAEAVEALTDSMAAQGGIGFAKQLYEAMTK